MSRPKMSYGDNYHKALPRNLREIMAERGCKQDDLAEPLHVTRQQIAQYLNGNNSPPWEKLVMIADYFRVSTDWLLGRSKYRTADQQIAAMRSELEDQKAAVAAALVPLREAYESMVRVTT